MHLCFVVYNIARSRPIAEASGASSVHPDLPHAEEFMVRQPSASLSWPWHSASGTIYFTTVDCFSSSPFDVAPLHPLSLWQFICSKTGLLFVHFYLCSTPHRRARTFNLSLFLSNMIKKETSQIFSPVLIFIHSFNFMYAFYMSISGDSLNSCWFSLPLAVPSLLPGC